MQSSIVNLIKPLPGGMSECTAAGKGYKAQQKCSFIGDRSSGGNHCEHEKFGKYCGYLPAQKYAAGQPILLVDITRDFAPKKCPDFDAEWRETSVKGEDGLLPEDISEYLSSDFVKHLTIAQWEAMKAEQKLPIEHRGIPYKGKDGKLCFAKPTPEHSLELKAEAAREKQQASSTRTAFRFPGHDPCIRCSKSYSFKGCDVGSCHMKERYETAMEVMKHERLHRLERSRYTVKGCRCTTEKLGNCLNTEWAILLRALLFPMRHGLTKCSDRIKEKSEQVARMSYLFAYLYSREISISTIQERYDSRLMVVMPATSIIGIVRESGHRNVAHCYADDTNLLFDIEHYVFYDKDGDLVVDLSKNFLLDVLKNWWDVVPKESLPELPELTF
jgi:hypothetical protein